MSIIRIPIRNLKQSGQLDGIKTSNSHKVVKMKKLVLVSIICLLLSSCSSQVDYVANSTTRTPRPKNCSIDVYLPGTSLNKPYSIIGSIIIGDSGFSVDCGQATVFKQVKEQGCLAGADAVLLTEIKEPDWLSTCYRIQGSMLVFTPSSNAPAIADDPVEAVMDPVLHPQKESRSEKMQEANKPTEESIDYVPIPFD